VDNEILPLTGDHPLVFGMKCPRCGSEHLVASLGTGAFTPDGEPIDVEPTLGLINIDPEEDIGTVRCWECYRTFRFHLCIIEPEPDDDPVN